MKYRLKLVTIGGENRYIPQRQSLLFWVDISTSGFKSEDDAWSIIDMIISDSRKPIYVYRKKSVLPTSDQATSPMPKCKSALTGCDL